MGGIIALPDSADGLVKHVHTSANVITIENGYIKLIYELEIGSTGDMSLSFPYELENNKEILIIIYNNRATDANIVLPTSNVNISSKTINFYMDSESITILAGMSAEISLVTDVSDTDSNFLRCRIAIQTFDYKSS